MFLAGIATWAVLAQPCVYCFILPRASEHHFRRCSSAHHFLPKADLRPDKAGISIPLSISAQKCEGRPLWAALF
jgi:hypothetical protein